MIKTIILLIFFMFLLNSCAETLGSVKRGMTGAKSNTTDEFLVEKKDPLILPPDYENLPSPDDVEEKAQTEISSFENIIETETETENQSSSSQSPETSIINKIRKK